jgi:serine/threonine protein kinase
VFCGVVAGGPLVAIKLMSREGAAHEEAVLRRLRGRGVAPELEERREMADGRVALVTRYAGRTAFKPKSWAEAEEATRKALRALATAHALGMVHGDLKPDHIAVLYPGCAQSMSDIAPCMPGEEEEHGAMEVRLVDWDSSVWRRGDGSVARGPRGATRGFEAPELRESRQASEAGAQRGAHGGRPVQGARSPGRRCARGALHPSGGAARAWGGGGACACAR